VLFDTIYIQNFRNIASLRIQPAPGINVIEGANGQGKTNLLEAIHLSVTLRSFRQHPTRDLIRIGEKEALIATRFDVDGISRDTELHLRGTRRMLKINGEKVRTLDDYFGTMRVVTFTPDDVNVFKEGPGTRRLFFDRMIFNLDPRYGAETLRFEQVLKQRNAALRQDPIDIKLLDVYEQVLADYGARITARRNTFFERFEAPLKEAFGEVFGTNFDVRLAYDGTYADRDALRDALAQQRARDIQRGHTTVGPHRDEIEAFLDDQPFKTYASQGQHRAFVLACKIAEIRLSVEAHASWPILLMDDVSSELDPLRNQHLFAFLDNLQTQVFITTTDHHVLQLPRTQRLWKMNQGDLQAEDA